MQVIWMICGLLLSLPSSSQAATYHVNSEEPGLYPTIQSAIDACVSGDTVLVAAGTYTGSGNVDLVIADKDIQLLGAGSDSTILDGEFIFDSASCIKLQGAVTRATCVSGFRIRRNIAGEGGGLLLWGDVTPLLRDLVVEECQAYGNWYASGCGVYCSGASPRLEDVVVRDNFTTNYPGGAGGMHCSNGGAIELIRVRFEGNFAGGFSSGAGVSLYCEEVEFVANSGDGLSLHSHSDLIILDSLFENNVGRGLSYHNHGAGLIENTRIIDNRDAGVFWSGGTSLVLRGCLIFGNNTHYSPGASSYGIRAVATDSLLLDGCTLLYNGSGADGAGVLLEMVDSARFQNSIIAHGGGVGVSWDGLGSVPVFECCDLYGNVNGSVQGPMGDPVGANGNIDLNPLICGRINDLEYLFTLSVGSPCLPENNSCGVLMGAFGPGCPAPTEAEAPSASIVNLSCYPNPFNPSIEISFTMSEAAKVILRIVDASGREERRLLNGAWRAAGDIQLTWDGRDDSGQPLPSGVYLCDVETGEYRATRKMTLLK